MGKCCNPVTDPKRTQPIIKLQNGTREKFFTFLPVTSTKKCQRKLASSLLPDKNKDDASKNDDPPPSPHSSSPTSSSAVGTRPKKNTTGKNERFFSRFRIFWGCTTKLYVWLKFAKLNAISLTIAIGIWGISLASFKGLISLATLPFHDRDLLFQ